MSTRARYARIKEAGQWTEFVRAQNLKQLYNMTPEDYADMLEAQGGVCAICSEPSDKNLHVDHDHACCPGRKSCGKCVRGLLCGSCNNMLGKIERKPEILNRASRYLVVTV